MDGGRPTVRKRESWESDGGRKEWKKDKKMWRE